MQFDVQLNVGLEAKPLARVASGGELSRLMLALKVVLARHDAIATLVFDEVDQGIGGEVGAQVGAALAEVAERHQVLVITHLPQIAARADRHLVVSKEARGGIATSDVQLDSRRGPGRRGRADARRHRGRCRPAARPGVAAEGEPRAALAPSRRLERVDVEPEPRLESVAGRARSRPLRATTRS